MRIGAVCKVNLLLLSSELGSFREGTIVGNLLPLPML